MTKDEIDQLHSLADDVEEYWDREDDADLLRAAITALEAAPSQVEAPNCKCRCHGGAKVEAPPSESARERALRWWFREVNVVHIPDGVAESLAREFDQHTDRLRAELEQARERANTIEMELAQTRGEVAKLDRCSDKLADDWATENARAERASGHIGSSEY